MNAIRMWVVGIVLGMVATGLQARESIENVVAASTWEIGPEVSYFRYNEPGDYSVKETGLLYGVAGAYTCPRDNGLLRIEAEFAFGLLDYDGYISHENTDESLYYTPYTMSGNRDFLLNLRLLWGQEWGSGDWDNRFTVGVGYRGLNDDSSQDPNGYDRQANYLYVPVGLKVCHELGDHWQIGLGGEIDVLLFGVQCPASAQRVHVQRAVAGVRRAGRSWSSATKADRSTWRSRRSFNTGGLTSPTIRRMVRAAQQQSPVRPGSDLTASSTAWAGSSGSSSASKVSSVIQACLRAPGP